MDRVHGEALRALLTRSKVMALAALRSAPFGLVSASAVARRSGLSATAAARALDALLGRDLVFRSNEVIAGGRAQPIRVWHANVMSDYWPELVPTLNQVVLPHWQQPKSSRVPVRLRHLFWNTAESQLDVDRAGAYIARRFLRTMDLQGLAWGSQALAPNDWRQAAGARGLDPKVRQLARNLADAAKIEVLDASGPDRLAEPTLVASTIGSVQNLMAMKLKVMAERGELRDYFDVKAIDEEGGVSVEEGIEFYMRRYRLNPSSEALPHLYKAMGDLSDVEPDELLPVELSELPSLVERPPGDRAPQLGPLRLTHCFKSQVSLVDAMSMTELIPAVKFPAVRPNDRLHRPLRIRVCIFSASVMIVFYFVLALQLASDSRSDLGVTPVIGGAVFFLAFAVPSAWLAWRISRAGLWIGADGILIRGPLRTWRIRQSEAVRFVPGVQSGPGNGTPCPMLERVKGAEVGVWALGIEGLIWKFDEYLEELEPLCGQLNELLEEQLPDHPLPVDHSPRELQTD